MIVDDQDINFTPRSQKLLQLCKEIATKLNHKNITTDHLFAAFFDLKKTRCIDILHECGLDINRFKHYLYSHVLLAKPKKKIVDFNVASEVKEVIKDATTIAKDFEHSWVSAEHIFLSFLNEPSVFSDEILSALKIDLELVTEKLLNYLCDNENHSAETQMGAQPDEVWDASFPILEKFATNLTKKALEGKLDPVYGRESETAKLQDILNRRKKNNAIIVGEAGVGKTAVVEGLVQNIINNEASYFLNSKIIYELNLSSMIAGTKYRGEFEARIKKIVEEAKDDKIILFIDEIHTLIGAGDAEGGLDAANILKPALSSGEITVIGATTFKEYRSKFVKDKALQRRFQPLTVNEPDKKATFKILSKKKEIYENFHGVLISDDMLYHLIEYADKYIFDNQFPDKAIDLMDLACSHIKVKRVVKPNKMQKIEDKLAESFIKTSGSFTSMDEDQAGLFESLKSMVEQWTEDLNKNKIKLEKKHVFEVLAAKTNIPLQEFLKSDVERHLNLEKNLKKKVIGQNEAIESISKCLLRHKSGLGDDTKPIGSFLFLGTTGVGKTYVAKMLANNFFLSKDNFIHLDMSEFSEESSVSKLSGANPGYIGYENGGLLVEKITKNPHSVVLFDEIEKAHPKVHQMLLQILDEGRLTDAQGRVANFKNSIVIVTGNIGSLELSKKQSIGFTDSITEESNRKDAFDKVKKALPLELINRFDDTLFFNSLGDDSLKLIIKKELADLKATAKRSSVNLIWSRNLVDFIFNKINQKDFGARMVKRVVQKEISDKISETILKNVEISDFRVNYRKKEDKIHVDF